MLHEGTRAAAGTFFRNTGNGERETCFGDADGVDNTDITDFSDFFFGDFVPYDDLICDT